MSSAYPPPPSWARRFLTWFCDEALLEEIAGDLEEAYYHRCSKLGESQARQLYVADVFTFFKPYAFEKYSRAKQFLPMMDNYFKIAMRNIFHLDIHRGRVQKVEPAAREHALPSAGLFHDTALVVETP